MTQRMSPRFAALLAFGLSAVLCSAQTALEVKASGARTFHADSRVGNNQVTFFSESTLEDFTGVCNQVGGQCALDPRNVESLRGRFFLRAKDLKTGIELRDRHMVGPDWLDADKHPEIAIEITGVTDAKRTSANEAKLTLIGACTIRGKTNEVRIATTLMYLDETPETMRRVKGDLLRLRSEFSLKLSDYGIIGPQGAEKLIGLKVADELKLKVTIFGSTEQPPDALKADAPAEGAAPPPPPRPRSRPE